MKLVFFVSSIFLNASTLCLSADDCDRTKPVNHGGKLTSAANLSQSTCPPENTVSFASQQSRFAELIDKAFSSGTISKELMDLIQLSAQKTLEQALSQNSTKN